MVPAAAPQPKSTIAAAIAAAVRFCISLAFPHYQIKCKIFHRIVSILSLIGIA
jgi:hypothetical protein